MNVNDFIKEILERLKQMDEEFIIDRYEGNIAVCENRKTGEIKEIPKDNIQDGLKEGSVIKLENGIYIQDVKEQTKIEQRIKDKIDEIWED